jgi:ATP-dependent Clp protease adapter protein ClpS
MPRQHYTTLHYVTHLLERVHLSHRVDLGDSVLVDVHTCGEELTQRRACGGVV